MTPLEGCPKAMVYGPCGGVSVDGGCEVGVQRCVFQDRRVAPYPQPGDSTFTVSAIASRPPVGDVATVAGRELLALMEVRPAVLTGIPAVPMSSASLRTCAEALVGHADAVLSGESGRVRVQFPPSYRAALMVDAGLRPVLGVNCRDRNRVALEGELIALADAGAAAALCLTGDHTDLGDRPDAMPVFDLEGTQLVPLARHVGLLTAVPESPFAPPVTQRGTRLAAKASAGAELALLQYVGDLGRLADFVVEVRELAPGLKVLPGIPLAIDREGAAVLSAFAAAEFPSAYFGRILDAEDPRAAGIAVAIELASAVLSIPGVAGVHVTGGARSGDEVDYCRALAVVAERLGGGGEISG